jgi:tetratricopeptide (TPR) repeat protein
MMALVAGARTAAASMLRCKESGAAGGSVASSSSFPTSSKSKKLGVGASPAGGSSVGNNSTKPLPSSLPSKPRPAILVSMLNNKAVSYMERQQYDQAKKSLARALRVAERHAASAEGPSRALGSGSHRPAAAKSPSCYSELDLLDETEPVTDSSSSSFATDLSGGDGPCSRSDELLDWPAELLVPSQRDDDSTGASRRPSASSCLSAFTKALSFDDDGEDEGEVAPIPVQGSSGKGSAASSSSAHHSNRHRAEYDEGMDVYRSPLRISDSSSRSVDGTILFNLARVHHNQGSYEEALALYKRSLRALEGWPVCDEALTMSILFGIGQIQYVRGDHSDSLRTYVTSLNFARSKFGSESVEVAACMNCIGVLHYIMPRGDSDAALEALKTSIRLRKEKLGENHIDVGTSWNNVGRVYFQQGRYDRAMDAYRRALRIRRKQQGAGVDVAATVFNIGQVLHQQGDQERALRHYQEFLRLARSHFGDFHRDICIVTTCIGQVFHEKKDFKRALRAFQHALKVGRVALGVHAEIAITLNKVGNLHYETGSYELALKAYHQGLEVELQCLEPGKYPTHHVAVARGHATAHTPMHLLTLAMITHVCVTYTNISGNPNICVTYTNIAEIYKQRSEHERALRYYEKVLDLQRTHRFEPLDIANTLSSIGYIRHQMGDYQQAMDVNQECLRLRREVKGDIDEEVASTLTHIALVLLKMELHDMALEVLTEAYRIRTALSKRPNREVAFCLYNCGLIEHYKGNHETALAYYLETARIEENIFGSAHRDLSITKYNIAQIYYSRGEMDLSVSNFGQALKIERECFGPDHPTCARTLNEIGNIELQRGNVDRMMACYTEALRIYRRAQISDDHLVVYGKSLWRFELVHPVAAGAA